MLSGGGGDDLQTHDYVAGVDGDHGLPLAIGVTGVGHLALRGLAAR